MRKLIVLVMSLILLVATDVRAQAQRIDLGFVSMNWAYQVGNRQFLDSLSTPLFDEMATFSVGHEFSSGGLFDVSGGVHVSGNLAVGFGITALRGTGTIVVDGSVPNPLFFDRPRTVTYQETGFNHRELGVHLQAVWFVPVNDKVDVALFWGPSLFSLRQDLVTTVETAEVGAPFDVVKVSRLVIGQGTQRGVGVNVGVDLTYLFTDNYGAGLFARWAGGSVDFPTSTGEHSVDVGGFQAGVGARLRF